MSDGEDAVILTEPSSNPSVAYLDSCFYLDYLKGDTPYHGALAAIIDAWKAGELEVVTSALTISEVLWVKCDDDGARMMIDRTREPEILDLFAPYAPRKLILVELDRAIGEASRQLVWDKNIKPKDAIHVASALAGNAEVLFTFDKPLSRHSGTLGGTPTLRLLPPAWVMRPALPEAEPIAEPAVADVPASTEPA